MNKLKDFIKNNQMPIVLSVGYLLVGAIGFGLGQLDTVQEKGPEIRLEATSASDTNYTPSVSGLQSPTDSEKCSVKGTASSRIYHLLGQTNYAKLSSPVCFDSEEQAQAAGYRKSLR